jgi:hypothetical protein
MANLTSKTCSHCGSVFSTEKLENIEPLFSRIEKK